MKAHAYQANRESGLCTGFKQLLPGSEVKVDRFRYGEPEKS